VSPDGQQWVGPTDGYCYLFWRDARYTWDEADEQCKASGAQLASIHSISDTAFINLHTEHLNPIGNTGIKNMWMGLKKSDNGKYFQVWCQDAHHETRYWKRKYFLSCELFFDLKEIAEKLSGWVHYPAWFKGHVKFPL